MQIDLYNTWIGQQSSLTSITLTSIKQTYILVWFPYLNIN